MNDERLEVHRQPSVIMLLPLHTTGPQQIV